MKVLNTIAKIVFVLAAIAGAVYVVATYGDQIVAWAKRIINQFKCSCGCCDIIEDDSDFAAEEVPACETDFEG